jgi:hypothetical protein
MTVNIRQKYNFCDELRCRQLQNFVERRKTIWELPIAEWTNCIMHQSRHLPYSSNGKYEFTWVALLQDF